MSGYPTLVNSESGLSARNKINAGLSAFAPNVRQFGATGNGSTDDATAITNAIASVVATGGGTLFFDAGIFICNSPIVLSPDVILYGAGIDATILKVGVDNIELLSPTGAAQSGVSGLENMTVWGYGDRNATQGANALVNIGPFDTYWIRKVKAIYSRFLSLTATGGIGYVQDCIVNKSMRDGINVSGTSHVFISGNHILECGDDAIAWHVNSSVSGIYDHSAVISNNKIEKSYGIKALGAINATITGNILRFFYGYGVEVGLDGSFSQGLNTKFALSIANNSFVDGMNSAIIGGGTLGTAVYISGSESLGTGGTAIAQAVGTYDSTNHIIQKPDVFINKVGTAQPRGPDGTISITGNTIRQTLAGMTNFSDAGFGSLWNSSGVTDPAVSSLIRGIDGIRINCDVENIVVSDNAIHGANRGIMFEGAFNNAKINSNTIFRTNNGILGAAGSALYGSIAIMGNLIDIDPYLESSQRTTPIDGSWTVTDSSTDIAITLDNYNGVMVSGNRFRNCIKVVKYVHTASFMTFANIVEFDWSSGSKGIANVPDSMDQTNDFFVLCFSDPTQANFNQYESFFNYKHLSSDTQPTAGYYYTGQFVKNSAPAKDASNMTIIGWTRLTTGNAHVAGTDWVASYTSGQSPAV